jgi:hypothetical protein
MGLSIHYNGQIKDTSLLPALVDEVKDICSILQWNYHLYTNDRLKGISFSPPGSEPLFFTFSPNGGLYSPIQLQYNIQSASGITVKTQFAGMDAHRAIIKLFKYLEAKYFSAFELHDEAGYWETGDEVVLRQQFSRYDFLLDAISDALQDFKGRKNETIESLADRLEKFLKERLRKL